MENVLGCVLIVAISFPVSFYLARACLSAVIRLIGGPEPRLAIRSVEWLAEKPSPVKALAGD